MSEGTETGEREEAETAGGSDQAPAAEESGTGKEEEDAVDAAPTERIADLESERDELAARVEELEEERGELTARLKRTAADFENYKKRKQRERERVQAEATEEVVGRLLDVRDNLKRAIDQEADDVDSLREGVKLTLDEFDRVLDAEDVVEIDPDPGTALDPERHEVMLQVDSDEPAGHIAEVYQSGYALGEKVLRPAQVTVSDGSAEADEPEER